MEATSFNNGLDADKSASPAVGDIWLARDTYKLYVCHVAGAWTGFDASILVQGILTLYADMVAGGHKLTGLGAPTLAADAARKTDVDTVDAKLDDVSVSQPVRALDTIYRNTSGKLLLVTINLFAADDDSVQFLVGAATPPTTIIGLEYPAGTGGSVYGTQTFIVPPLYYYEALTASGTPSLYKWTEFVLL